MREHVGPRPTPPCEDYCAASDGPERAIAGGIAAGLLQAFVSLIVTPIQTALLVRSLPAAEAGVWFVSIALTNYLAVFDFGIAPTLARHVAFLQGRFDAGAVPAQGLPRSVARALDREEALADQIATATRLNLALILLLLAVSGVAALTVLPALFGRALDPGTAFAWGAFAAGSALNLKGSLGFAALAGKGHVGLGRLARGIAQVLGLGAMAVVLLHGLGLPGAASAWLGQNLVYALLAHVAFRRWFPRALTAKGRLRNDVAIETIGPSARWAGMSLGAVLILQIGPVLLAWQLGPESVPPYAVVGQLGLFLLSGAMLPATVTEPFIARAYAASDLPRARGLVMRNARIVTAVTGSICVTVAAAGAELIGLWVGPDHFAGYAVLWIFLASILLETHHVVHASAVMATGRVIFLPWAIGAGLLNLALGWVLVKPLGLVGMAIATAAAQLVTNNWFAPWVSLRLFGVRASEYGRGMCTVALLVVASAVAAGLTRTLLADAATVSPSWILGATAAAAGVVALPSLWFAVLTRGDRAWLGVRISGALRRWTRRQGARTGPTIALGRQPDHPDTP